MKFETLSDWCKFLEKNFSPEIMIPTLPVIIRLDGSNFSSYTKNLTKPFDNELTDLMIELSKFLVKETNAVISYHQSDEITLILYSPNREVGLYNDGKKQKILSKLTGKAVSFFNENRPKYLPKHNYTANFDCRIYQTPTLHDACQQITWRENDATKNSISMLASSMFSDKQLHGLNGNEKQEKMLLERDINWNDLKVKFKRGTYVRRTTKTSVITTEELSILPPQHNAHKTPGLEITRNVVEVVDMPIFNRIINQVDVIFNGIEPQLKEQDGN